MVGIESGLERDAELDVVVSLLGGLFDDRRCILHLPFVKQGDHRIERGGGGQLREGERQHRRKDGDEAGGHGKSEVMAQRRRLWSSGAPWIDERGLA